MALTKELIDRFMKVDPAQLGHFVKNGYMNTSIKPVSKDFKMIGPAVTVRMTGDSNIMLYYAVEHAPKGSVIVVDRGGENIHACCGDGCSLNAQCQGMAGIVIDGPATDSAGIVSVGLPVFATGLSVVTTTIKEDKTASFNVPVNCCGVVVNPGDIIFGNAEGVIVMKPEECEKLLEMGEAGNRAEQAPDGMFAGFRSGKKMSDYFPIINAALKIAGEEANPWEDAEKNK